MAAQTDKPTIQVDSITELQNRQKVLTRSAISTLATLVVQYILGMINNFYVQFPDSTEPGVLWPFALSQITEILHIIIGSLLVLSAPVFVVRAIMAKDQTWVIASSIGLAGIIIAIFGGVFFVSTQNDFYSLLMSIGFLAAFVAYGWGLYMKKK